MRRTIGRIGRITWLLGLGVWIAADCPAARGGFIEVSFPSGPRYVEAVPPPIALDRAFSDPALGDAHGVFDSTTWSFKGTVSSSTESTFGVNGRLDDIVHFHGSGTVTVFWQADGFGLLPAPPENGATIEAHLISLMNVQVPISNGNAGVPVDVVYTTNTDAPPGVIHVTPDIPFPIHLTTFATFDVVNGESREIDTILRLLTAGGGVSLDFSHTARLSFDLPPGVSVSADGGFSQAASFVPEPSSLALFGSGAAVCLLVHAVRRRIG